MSYVLTSIEFSPQSPARISMEPGVLSALKEDNGVVVYTFTTIVSIGLNQLVSAITGYFCCKARGLLL